ncbi:MAG: type III pantothenate kinase [Sedimentisphaerales bacterium]|nr:type III pantothenate kinase [Sedimentisphaerales bacterium]
MNIIAIDIGNTTIKIGLFVEDSERFIRAICEDEDTATQKLGDLLSEAWNQFPVIEGSRESKRNGWIVVSSVQDAWTKQVETLCRDQLGEKIFLIGRDVPLPIEMGVENPAAVGTDRVVNAAAAFAVIEDACVVADFGTAVTIDLVDENGVFLGGVIAPGFAMGAKALHTGTSKLPLIDVTVPIDPIGANTEEAMNSGLFYSAVGLLRVIVEKFAEQLGRWPQTVVTGGTSRLLKGSCDFIDSWVDDLAVRGVVLAYKKYMDDQAEIAELDQKNRDIITKKQIKRRSNMN